MTDAWPPSSEPPSSLPPSAPPPSPGPGMGQKLALIGGALLVILLVVGAVVVLAGDDGDDDGDDDNQLTADVQGAGENVATRGRTDEDAPSTTEPDGTTTTEPEETTTTEADDHCPTAGEAVDRDSLPDPDTSAEPLQLEPNRAGRGTEWPVGLDETWPYLGEVYATPVSPGSHTDIPIHLEAGEYAVVFAANDCIKGSIQIYAPSGELVADATDLGDPGTVEGWEFANLSDDALTESGTYVFRVIQDTGENKDGFPLRFYGPQG